MPAPVADPKLTAINVRTTPAEKRQVAEAAARKGYPNTSALIRAALRQQGVRLGA